MSDFTAGIIVAMLCGALLGAMIHGVYSGTFDAIRECEANLPRDQFCELTARPKQEAAGHEQ